MVVLSTPAAWLGEGASDYVSYNMRLGTTECNHHNFSWMIFLRLVQWMKNIQRNKNVSILDS